MKDSSPHPPYRMPAEWEPHAATWIAWPHNPDADAVYFNACPATKVYGD